jgi:hypothetical protein
LLQQKDDVNFQKLVDLALAIETSNLESKQIQSPYCTESTHQTAVRSDSGNFTRCQTKKVAVYTAYATETQFFYLRGKCFRCGNASHKADNCRFMNAVCNTCHTKGHIQSVCMKGRATRTHVHQQQIVGKTDIYHDNLHGNITTTTNTINSIETPQNSTLDVHKAYLHLQIKR